MAASRSPPASTTTRRRSSACSLAGAACQHSGPGAVRPQESLRLTDGQPRTKINLGLDYDYEWFGLTARTNRYGKVLGAGSEPFNDVRLGAKWVTDLEIRAQALDTVEFAIGATTSSTSIRTGSRSASAPIR
jgi:hypothetical protein